MSEVADNRVRIELVGQVLRWATPVLLAITLYLLNNMNVTLSAIQTDISVNTIASVKLQENQRSFRNAFSVYKITDGAQIKDLKSEINEVNDEIDNVVNQIHGVEVEIRGYHNRNGD